MQAPFFKCLYSQHSYQELSGQLAWCIQWMEGGREKEREIQRQTEWKGRIDIQGCPLTSIDQYIFILYTLHTLYMFVSETYSGVHVCL